MNSYRSLLRRIPFRCRLCHNLHLLLLLLYQQMRRRCCLSSKKHNIKNKLYLQRNSESGYGAIRIGRQNLIVPGQPRNGVWRENRLIPPVILQLVISSIKHNTGLHRHTEASRINWTVNKHWMLGIGLLHPLNQPCQRIWNRVQLVWE